MGYSLHLQAQDDLEAIWKFSYQEWGTEQADQYIRSLLYGIDIIGIPHQNMDIVGYFDV